MALPVNFKDDVLASSMDGKRRYNMITNSDGTVSFEDVTTYSQEGSNFGSAQINNTNGEINKINNNVLDTIEEISANTSGGKFAGALALKNVNNSLEWKLIGSATGKTPITLPSNFSEILVIVKTVNYFYNFNIPKLYLDETDKMFCHGQGLHISDSNYLVQVRILISTNKVALSDARSSQNASLKDNTSTAIITAYYR